jgi:hypothetical protein
MLKGKLIIYASVGILAYIITDFIHEVIGHGGTCLLLGNKITLLTSVYFKSTPGNIFVDIGGPIANLIFTILTFLILNKAKKLFAILLLIHISIYNLFWFVGTILHSSVSKNGDWTFATKELNMGRYQIYILAITGILLYVFTSQFLSRRLRKVVKENNLTKQDFILPFLFASISAFVAGFFFTSDRLHSGLEGLLEMAASIPILFLRLPYADTNKNYRVDYKLIFAVGILYLLFCFTLGQGIKF